MSIRGRLSRTKSDLYQILVRHPFLDALQYLVRNFNNKEQCRRIAGRDGLVLKCNFYGNSNKDKCIYYIRFGGAEHGFFGQFRILLKYLAYADRIGFYRVVEWPNNFPYAEKEGVRGIQNPFEYYFDQPMGISLEDMRKSYNVFCGEEIHITDFYLDKEIPGGEEGYMISEAFIERLAEIMRKYIRLNSWTENYMQQEIGGLLQNKKTVGVHVRGSDYKKNYNNHPAIVPVKEYIRAAERLMRSGKYEQVFLATDDMEALELFSSVFADKLVYYKDVIRTKGNVSVAFSKKRRNNHRYRLGLEVLRDMMSLAACDGLVAGISQVSNCARITRRSDEKNYEDMVILDRGINHTRNDFVR